MSAAEIIAELPKLNEADLSAVWRKLRELKERDELAGLHDAADAMFQDMDRNEVSHASGKARCSVDSGFRDGCQGPTLRCSDTAPERG